MFKHVPIRRTALETIERKGSEGQRSFVKGSRSAQLDDSEMLVGICQDLKQYPWQCPLMSPTCSPFSFLPL
jgi:hypothetical protein